MPHDEPDAARPDRPKHSADRTLDAQAEDQYRRILRFELTWLQHSAAKQAAVASEFNISIVRYYQLVEAALNTPDLPVDVATQEGIEELRVRSDRRRHSRTTPPASN